MNGVKVGLGPKKADLTCSLLLKVVYDVSSVIGLTNENVIISKVPSENVNTIHQTYEQ